MKFRSISNFHSDENSLGNSLVCVRSTLAQQHCKENCDINAILRRYGQGARSLSENPLPPLYEDLSTVGDYHSAMNLIREAGEGFAALPSLVRDRFRNDPVELMSFLADSANRPEAAKLGLLRADLHSAPDQSILDVTGLGDSNPAVPPSNPLKGSVQSEEVSK